jgi:hypothetical protein
MSLILGRYDVVRRLAVGGMGEVFLAVQRGAGGVARTVILKAMLPDLARDPAAVRGFLDEARVISTLNHPNVVSLYEVGVWQDLPLIAMEFVHGRTVSQVTRRCAARGVAMPAGVALTIARDAARGLMHAHLAKGADGAPLELIHRDVSPQNIMVRTDGVAKVLDFGIAHSAGRATRTATGLVKGKLVYMAPEQARGERLTQRVDQFALGVVLWELLAGRRLRAADNEALLVQQVIEAVTPRLSAVGGPAVCDELVGRMLHPDVDRRFSDCGAVAAAIDALLPQLEGGPDAVAQFMASLGTDDLEGDPLPSLHLAVVPPAGLPPEIPTATVGAPTAVGAQVPAASAARNGWRTAVLLAVALLGGAGAWRWASSPRAATEVEVRARFALEQNARLAEKTVDLFCAEADRLRPLWPRAEGPYERNAAPFLEPLLPIEGHDGGALALPSDLVARAELRDDAGTPRWTTAFKPEELALDTGWLSALAAYDHWWPSPGSRLSTGTGTAGPDYRSLSGWATLSFARGLRDGDIAPALAEVAQLRRLLRSQGNLLAEMVGLSLERVAREGLEAALAGGLETRGLAALTAQQHETIKLHSFSAPTYAWPGVPPDVTARALSCSLSPCVLLSEGLRLHAVVGHLAPRETRSTLDTLLGRTACDRETILREAARPEMAVEDGLRWMTTVGDPLRRVYERP